MSALPATIYHLTDTLQTYIAPKREERMTGFARVANTVARNPKISAQAKAMYLVLASYVGGNEECWPSAVTLAADLGVHERTARKWLAELQECGAVEVEDRPGKASIYRLLTPGVDATPEREARGTPGVETRTPRAETPDDKEQGRRTGEEEQAGETARKTEPTLPAGVELVDGRPRLAPIAYDGEGKPVHSSEAIAYVARRAYDIPESYERPLRAWIETHGNVIPRQHDVRALMRLVDSAGEAAVTRAIRRMGNEGFLKFSRLETAVREGGRNG